MSSRLPRNHSNWRSILLASTLLFLVSPKSNTIVHAGGGLGTLTAANLISGGLSLSTIVAQLGTAINPALSTNCQTAILGDLLPLFTACGGLSLFTLVGGQISQIDTSLTSQLCATPACTNAVATFTQLTLAGCGNINTAIINPANATAALGTGNLLSLIGDLGVNQVQASANSSLQLACVPTADGTGYCLNELANRIAAAEGLAVGADVEVFDARAQSLLATPQIACTSCIQRQVSTALANQASIAYQMVAADVAAAQVGLNQCASLATASNSLSASPTAAGGSVGNTGAKTGGRGNYSGASSRREMSYIVPLMLVVALVMSFVIVL